MLRIFAPANDLHAFTCVGVCVCVCTKDKNGAQKCEKCGKHLLSDGQKLNYAARFTCAVPAPFLTDELQYLCARKLAGFAQRATTTA